MKASERGFTLVEMLVALMIFGVLAAAGVTVMRTSIQSQSAVRARVDRIGEFQRVRATLKADLGQAVSRRTRSPDGVQQPSAFAGGDAPGGGPVLVLVRRGWENPDNDPRASLQYVEYRLDGRRLERRARPMLDGAVLGEPQLLSESIEALHVAFYYREQWRDLWNEPDLLPEVVRLDLQIEGVGPVTQLFLTPGRSL